jgi:hypothetical protein|tara:strand:+ start:1488 stop:1895 length:408 start_codon:yes stop_codon:yes gene_type:complete
MADEKQQMDALLDGAPMNQQTFGAISQIEMDMQLLTGVLQLMGDPDGSLAETMAMVKTGQPLNDDQRRAFSTMIIENIDSNSGMTEADRAIQKNDQFNQRAQNTQVNAIRNAEATRMPDANMARPPMARPAMIGE